MHGPHRTIEDRIAEKDDDHPGDNFPYSAMGEDVPDHLSPRQAMHWRREQSVHEAEAQDIERHR